MKSIEEIQKGIQRLKENKEKTKQFSAFGDDNHRLIDVMLETLENNYDGDDLDRKFKEDNEYNSAYSILDWKLNDEDIEDYLYPEY